MPQPNCSPQPVILLPEITVRMVNAGDEHRTEEEKNRFGKSETQPVIMMPEISCVMAPPPPTDATGTH